MVEVLLDYIKDKIGNELSDLDIKFISEVFHVKKIRKHQFLLQEGDVCKTVAFVAKGALKKYTIDDTGKENIIELFIENWWAGDRESFSIGTPSPYYIDAYEDSVLMVLTKENFIKNRDKLQTLITLSNVLTERQSLQLIKRLHSTQTFTAEQKIEQLQNTYPEFFQRFLQHIIASYLGMTKETLSRIRSNALRK
jgi:CRP-like cAMP-binding protein